MLGIDIYDRYQDVSSWRSVFDHGVRYVYVKGTDGGAPAVVRADAFVAGAKGIGIPVGLYHYAQQSPSPEAQADVLAREVNRLGATGLPPCLDFEGHIANTLSASAGADFCQRFIRRLREAHGFTRVTLYANTSHLAKVNPDSWHDADLVIWAARYGANDGLTYPGLGSYRGRVDIHQWTDKGRVPGIGGSVDLNRALTNILEEDDMSAVDSERIKQLVDVFDDYYVLRQQHHGDADSHNLGTAIFLIEEVLGEAFALSGGTGVGKLVWQLKQGVAELLGRDPADVDEQAVATRLAPMVIDRLLPNLGSIADADVARLARAAADEVDRRARDNDPATGPTS